MLGTMHLSLIALIFSIIFVAELPDKSLFATLILSSRFPSWMVWLGAASAFLVHVVIAVTFGRFLTLLPHRLLEVVIAALFLIGAALVFFGKHEFVDKKKHVQFNPQRAHQPWLIFATAFSVVFIGEWGDITQIVTADYAAKYHDPVNVAIGATLGLWTVSAMAVVVGSRALTLISPKVLQRITGIVLLLFGIISLVAAV